MRYNLCHTAINCEEFFLGLKRLFLVDAFDGCRLEREERSFRVRLPNAIEPQTLPAIISSLQSEITSGFIINSQSVHKKAAQLSEFVSYFAGFRILNSNEFRMGLELNSFAFLFSSGEHQSLALLAQPLSQPFLIHFEF